MVADSGVMEASLPETVGVQALLPQDTEAGACRREIAALEGMLRQVRVAQKEAEFQCSMAEMEGEDAQMQKMLSQLFNHPFDHDYPFNYEHVW